jgi:nucleoside phosphorylase
VTILVPRGAEAGAVRRSGTPATIVEIGAGSSAAEVVPDVAGTEVVVLGLCGALRTLRAGDVVVYRRVTDAGGSTATDPALLAAMRAAIPAAQSVDACSTDHVVTSVRERAELAVRFGADVVDMEGSALAVALAARNVRFTMVRVVSDDASRDLPALEGAIRSDGRLDAVRIALAFARRPRAAIAFVRDVRAALRTLTAVASVLY